MLVQSAIAAEEPVPIDPFRNAWIQTRDIVAKQRDNTELWKLPTTAQVGQLQKELRVLHAVLDLIDNTIIRKP